MRPFLAPFSLGVSYAVGLALGASVVGDAVGLALGASVVGDAVGPALGAGVVGDAVGPALAVPAWWVTPWALRSGASAVGDAVGHGLDDPEYPGNFNMVDGTTEGTQVWRDLMASYVFNVWWARAIVNDVH